MNSVKKLYTEWNKATRNVNRANSDFEYIVEKLRSKKNVTPSDIKNLVSKFDNFQNSKLQQDMYMTKLHRANFSEETFKGKSQKIGRSKPKIPVKNILRQVYGSNRSLRAK